MNGWLSPQKTTHTLLFTPGTECDQCDRRIHPGKASTVGYIYIYIYYFFLSTCLKENMFSSFVAVIYSDCLTITSLFIFSFYSSYLNRPHWENPALHFSRGYYATIRILSRSIHIGTHANSDAHMSKPSCNASQYHFLILFAGHCFREIFHGLFIIQGHDVLAMQWTDPAFAFMLTWT